jgi:hypothetical protein
VILLLQVLTFAAYGAAMASTARRLLPFTHRLMDEADTDFSDGTIRGLASVAAVGLSSFWPLILVLRGTYLWLWKPVRDLDAAIAAAKVEAADWSRRVAEHSSTDPLPLPALRELAALSAKRVHDLEARRWT